MKKDKKIGNVKGIKIVAALLISAGTITLINFAVSGTTGDQQAYVVNDSGDVKIPAIQLPKDSSNADMIGLIVYKGKIYTDAGTTIDAVDAKAVIGDKLGTTKGGIDEWSKRIAYNKEFASTIGKRDVYSVKGYDTDFRIMVYQDQSDTQYAAFYENLNGITISSGEDVFGKLKIVGNVSSAQWRTFSDWYNDIDTYKPISDMAGLNTFLNELKKTKPFPRELNSDPISNAQNNDEYRELTLNLNDGSMVKLTLLKDGSIYYGYTDVYFQMNENTFSAIWTQLN